MRVNLAIEALNDDAAWSYLDQIAFEFTEGRHIWDIDDPDTIKESRWIQSDITGRSGKWNLALAEKAFTNAIYFAKGTVAHSLVLTVVSKPAASGEATPADALQCMREAVHVLVENVHSDEAFLQAIATAHGRDFLLAAIENKWLTLEQMGGFGEVERRFAQLARGRKTYKRLYVLTDSDMLYPGHQTLTSKKVQGACENSGVPCTILKKRKIENYLPTEALQGINTTVFTAFLHLSDEQKDFYDLKKGFDVVAGRVQISPDQSAVFRGVRPAVLRDLRRGFGKNISDRFRDGLHHITEATLRARCTAYPSELAEMLDAIERLL